MAEIKLSELPLATTMAAGDKIPFTSDPGGTPISKNITKTNLFSNLTTGYIPYKPAGALANSPIFTNGTNVGIGTTDLGDLLTVAGMARLDRNIAASNATWIRLFRQGVEKSRLGLDASDNFAILSILDVPLVSVANAGNVGIGTTAPTQKLQITSGNIALDSSQWVGNSAYDSYYPYSASTYGLNNNSGSYRINIDSNNTDADTQDFVIGKNQSTGDSTNNVLMIVKEIGNVGIGTTTFGAGAVRVLTLANGTAPGALANTASIVSLSGELYGVDAAGNQTLNSPHKEKILNQSPLSLPYPWGYHAKNPYLGKEVFLDWSMVIAEIERMSGKKFVTYQDIPIEEKRSWSEDQDKWIQEEKERRIAQKMNEEVEINLSMATEEVPEMKMVESGEFETKHSLVEWKIVITQVPIMKSIPNGKVTKKLKDGIRLDEKTGKLFRKKTRIEAESLIDIPVPMAPPKWMVDRGVN